MRVLEGLLHALCVIVAIIGGVGLVLYTAAALAIVKAGEWMEDSDETD